MNRVFFLSQADGQMGRRQKAEGLPSTVRMLLLPLLLTGKTVKKGEEKGPREEEEEEEKRKEGRRKEGESASEFSIN